MKKRILCFGDSNTWGFTPLTGERYDEHTRWTGVLQDQLGDDYVVLEDGMNARTSAYDDMRDLWRRGRDALPISLITQKPLDLLVISLGTNDLKFTDARGAAKGVESLISLADMVQCKKESSLVFPNGMKVLVISPIRIGKKLDDDPNTTIRNGYTESQQFSERFRHMCQVKGVEFLDAAEYAEPSAEDAIHMKPEGHRALGMAVAEKVKAILEAEK